MKNKLIAWLLLVSLPIGLRACETDTEQSLLSSPVWNITSSASGNDSVLKKIDTQAVTVTKVVDGDTFWAKFPDDEEHKVRLIGVDTPESVHSDESKNCEEGRIASNYTKELISKGSLVYLEYDAATDDKYGRILAYVYLEDGRMLQDVLLSEGYARIMTVQPNVKYQAHFLEIQKKARKEQKGFWADYFVKEQ